MSCCVDRARRGICNCQSDPKATRIQDQPPPRANSGAAIWDLVIADMKERDHVGRQRYGTPLQAFNGREPLVDAYQEILDLAVYVRQEIEERAITEAGRKQAIQMDWAEGARSRCSTCGEIGGTTAPFSCYDCCVLCKICQREPAHPYTHVCDGCKRHLNEQYPNTRNQQGQLMVAYCHSCGAWNGLSGGCAPGECSLCGWSEGEALDHTPEQQAVFEQTEQHRCDICEEQIYFSNARRRWVHLSSDTDHEARARHA